ncbi:hypothetical protein SAMN06298216_2828 [Spirosomataceae bacterium TFI 002]|nr:hypothetical protein SAMN06298216_2828 [Spirosomataceae bacterium TFI 002]
MKFYLSLIITLAFLNFSCTKDEGVEAIKDLALGSATAEVAGKGVAFNTAAGAFNPALKSFSIALNGTPSDGGTALITTVALNLSNFQKGDTGTFPCVEKTSGTSTQVFGSMIQTTLSGNTGGVITGGQVEIVSWNEKGVLVKFEVTSKGDNNTTMVLTKGQGNINLLN